MWNSENTRGWDLEKKECYARHKGHEVWENISLAPMSGLNIFCLDKDAR